MSHSARSNQTILSLDALEARDVPSAATLDLTTREATGWINGAQFTQVDEQPTGTGVIESFVRVQALGNKSTEQGYNTSARPLQFDENKSPVFTHGVTVGSLPLVSIGGGNYRELLLDINQKASSSTLSLDELRVYVGAGGGSLTGYSETAKTLAGMTAVYDLDAGGVDRWIKLDARLNHGSGSGDMLFYVPDSLLGGAGNNFYLFSKFGTNIATNGGFEEWARGTGGSSVSPESSTLSGKIFLLGEAGSTNMTGATVILTFPDLSTDEATVFVGADDPPGTYSYEFNNFLLEGETTVTLQVKLAGGQFLFFAPEVTTMAKTLSVGTNFQDFSFS